MGYLARKEVREVPISLSYTDAQNYLKKFKAFDRDGDGHIRYACMHGYPPTLSQLVTIFLSTLVTEFCPSDLSCLCSVLDLRKVLTEMGETVDESHLRDLIAEVDLNKNNTIEEDEFLQVRMYVHSQQPHGTV